MQSSLVFANRTIQELQNFARVHVQHGRYEQAATIYRECLERQQIAFGSDHEDTLETARQLARPVHWNSLKQKIICGNDDDSR